MPGLHFGTAGRSIELVRKAEVSLVPWVVRWIELKKECQNTIALEMKRKSLLQAGHQRLRVAARFIQNTSRNIDEAGS
jgi:hypothetical protein